MHFESMAELRIASYLDGLYWAGSSERLTLKSAHEIYDYCFLIVFIYVGWTFLYSPVTPTLVFDFLR